jgi:hypothetical protein
MSASRHRVRLEALAALLLFSAATPFAMAEALHFTPNRSDYAAGETVGWDVSLAPGVTPRPGSYTYTVIRDGKVQVTTGSFTIKDGHAGFAFKAKRPGAFRIVVDYLAPPPAPPPSPAQMKRINAGMRALLIAADPALKAVLDKYPNYRFVRPQFDFSMFAEDRVATLHASVAARSSR